MSRYFALAFLAFAGCLRAQCALDRQCDSACKSWMPAATGEFADNISSKDACYCQFYVPLPSLEADGGSR
jgi:hypothetical protein